MKPSIIVILLCTRTVYQLLLVLCISVLLLLCISYYWYCVLVYQLFVHVQHIIFILLQEYDINYVPCSGLTGDNLIKCFNESHLCNWYKGSSLVQCIGKYIYKLYDYKCKSYTNAINQQFYSGTSEQRTCWGQLFSPFQRGCPLFRGSKCRFVERVFLLCPLFRGSFLEVPMQMSITYIHNFILIAIEPHPQSMYYPLVAMCLQFFSCQIILILQKDQQINHLDVVWPTYSKLTYLKVYVQ